MHPLVWIGVALLVLWAVAWLGFKIVTGLIHLVLLIGVALVIWGLLKKGVRAVGGGGGGGGGSA